MLRGRDPVTPPNPLIRSQEPDRRGSHYLAH